MGVASKRPTLERPASLSSRHLAFNTIPQLLQLHNAREREREQAKALQTVCNSIRTKAKADDVDGAGDWEAEEAVAA